MLIVSSLILLETVFDGVLHRGHCEANRTFRSREELLTKALQRVLSVIRCHNSSGVATAKVPKRQRFTNIIKYCGGH